MSVEVHARESDRSRCAFCHDALVGERVECPRCGTLLHPECVARAQCPTLGCGHAFETARVHESVREPAGIVAGFVLPLLAFPFGELLLGRGEPDGLVVPEARSDWGAWVFQARSPLVARYFYPLLAWALAAYVAAFLGRRAPWVRVGLWGGAVLALVFSALYAPLAPASVVLIVAFGLGLLGLSPIFALCAYLARAVRYEREAPPPDPKSHDARRTLGLATLWSVLAGGAASLAIQRMSELYAALPEHRHDCWLATVAARGDPRVTGARPVLVRGEPLLVSDQLRTFKAFEIVLAALAPRAHRAVRAVYDRVGPPLARRVGPRGATALHLLLVPAQLVARLTLAVVIRDGGAAVRAVHPVNMTGRGGT